MRLTVKSNRRMIAISILIAGLLGSSTSVNCPASHGAESKAAADAAKSDPQLNEIYRELETLVREFYPRAKFSRMGETAHFELKVKNHLSGSGLTVLAPESGGILGDLQIKPGEYSGKDKDRLPSETLDSYTTTMVLAPYNRQKNTHLLVKLVFPPDLPVDFKEQFKSAIAKFSAGNENLAAVPPQQTQTATDASTTQKANIPLGGETPQKPAAQSQTQAAYRPPATIAEFVSERAQKKSAVKKILSSILPTWSSMFTNSFVHGMASDDEKIAAIDKNKKLNATQKAQQKQAQLAVFARKEARIKQLIKSHGINMEDWILDLAVDSFDGGLELSIQDYLDLDSIAGLISRTKDNLQMPADLFSKKSSIATDIWKEKIGTKMAPIITAYDARFKPMLVELGLDPSKPASTKPPAPEEKQNSASPADTGAAQAATSESTTAASDERTEKKAIVRSLCEILPGWAESIPGSYIDQFSRDHVTKIEEDKKLTPAQRAQKKQQYLKLCNEAKPRFKKMLEERKIDMPDCLLGQLVDFGDKLLGWSLQDYKELSKLKRLVADMTAKFPEAKTAEAFGKALSEKIQPIFMSAIKSQGVDKFKPVLYQVYREEEAGYFKVTAKKK